MTEPPKGLSEKRIDEFTITTDLANGRLFFVEGEAIERFAGMTNWDYYEAQLRFQKVLEASGAGPAQSSLKPGIAHAHKKAHGCLTAPAMPDASLHGSLAVHISMEGCCAVWSMEGCCASMVHGRVLRQYGS